MTQAELGNLPTDELIELVLRLEAINENLRAENAELQARIAELEAKQNRPPKTSKNSSVPPSAGRKANRKRSPRQSSDRKRGAKVGHKGTSRRRDEPNVVIECRVDTCPDCGTELAQVEQQLVGSTQVIEIPPIEPVVVEARRYGCSCPECGAMHVADYPAGMESERVFGRRLETIVTYLHEVHHLSYARLQTVMRVFFGLVISLGALVNAVRRVAERMEPAAEAIRDEIRQSQVVGCDETGARVNGRNHWQWVFVTATATYHVIAPSRGSGVIAKVMGDAVPLVWVSDLWSAQLKAAKRYLQICHAHQLRDLQYAIDAERSAWAYRFQQLLLRSQRLSKQRAQLPVVIYRRAVAQLEADCNTLLLQLVQTPEAQKLLRRYQKHRFSLFVFLYHPEVPYDNNGSERALRNSVIHRKVSGGFRSEAGADAHAIVCSVVDTARKRDQDILSVLQDLIGPPAPTPAATYSLAG
jgi:transposase